MRALPTVWVILTPPPRANRVRVTVPPPPCVMVCTLQVGAPLDTPVGKRLNTPYSSGRGTSSFTTESPKGGVQCFLKMKELGRLPV